jgi:hypothetical protein
MVETGGPTMPADRDAQHLVYGILYRPGADDPLPDPDTSATTRRLWATAGRIIEALRRDAFERHLDQHQCGTGDHKSPHYIGGFMKCPEAVSLWRLLPDDDQIILAEDDHA